MKEFIEYLRDDHSDFNKGSLDDQVKVSDPLLLFHKWYQEAFEKNCADPHAMVISTVNTDMQPSSRTVFMKELVEEGLIFFTNYNSQKGKEMIANPKVSILFYWDCLERQVRIHGEAKKAPKEISDDYFASRPRGSQIGAWASHQSDEIDSRELLEKSFQEAEEKFKGKKVPRPDFWGGFLIKPTYFEFWQGRPNRLHDRICFEKTNKSNPSWNVIRKNP